MTQTLQTPTAEKALTLEEVANLLCASERVVYSDLRTGKLTGCKVGNSWRFSRSDLEEYLGVKRTRDLLGPTRLEAALPYRRNEEYFG